MLFSIGSFINSSALEHYPNSGQIRPKIVGIIWANFYAADFDIEVSAESLYYILCQ